ncbi:MAG: universal stress protein [Nocardioidaceae bacterium]
MAVTEGPDGIVQERPSTIVVAVDGSEANDAALSWAADAATRTGAGLKLVHIIDENLRLSPYFTIGYLEHEARRVLTEARKRVEQVAPGVEVRTRAAFGRPATSLVEESADAALLVLGRRGHGAFKRLLIGSVSATAAGRSTVPAVVIPRAWDIEDHRRAPVVVGIDGSSRSESALPYAVELAATLDVELRVLYVWGGDLAYSSDTAFVRETLERWRDDAKALVNTAVEPWRRKYPALTITQLTQQGHVVGALAEESEAAQAVVVGGRPAGRMHAFIAGSVAYGVLHHASSPVIVVRGRA